MDDVLGSQDREADAIAALGRWRMGLRTRVLAVACLAGVLATAFGIWIVTILQFEMWGYALLLLTIGVGGALPFCASVIIGLLVARGLIAARTETQLAMLAKQYKVEVAVLHEFNRMLKAL